MVIVDRGSIENTETNKTRSRNQELKLSASQYLSTLTSNSAFLKTAESCAAQILLDNRSPDHRIILKGDLYPRNYVSLDGACDLCAGQKNFLSVSITRRGILLSAPPIH